MGSGLQRDPIGWEIKMRLLWREVRKGQSAISNVSFSTKLLVIKWNRVWVSMILFTPSVRAQPWHGQALEDPIAVLWRFPVRENRGDLGPAFEELPAGEQRRSRLEDQSAHTTTPGSYA